jgi:hypothetical protein
MQEEEDPYYGFVDSIKNKERRHSHLQGFQRWIKKVIPKSSLSRANQTKKKHYRKDKS